MDCIRELVKWKECILSLLYEAGTGEHSCLNADNKVVKEKTETDLLAWLIHRNTVRYLHVFVRANSSGKNVLSTTVRDVCKSQLRHILIVLRHF